MSLTTTKRKILSKTVLDIINSRKDEYTSITDETTSVIDKYSKTSEEDYTQRLLFEAPAKLIINAIKELILYNNIKNPENNFYDYIDIQPIDIKSKFWDNTSRTINDVKYFWDLLPDYTNRSLNILNTSNLFTNLDFNTISTGEGNIDPIINNIKFDSAYTLDSSDSSNNINLIRLFEAASQFSSDFISNGSFIDHGINFTNTSEWPPYMYGVTYLPSTIIPDTYQSFNSLNILSTTVSGTVAATISSVIPENKYYIAVNETNTKFRIIKIYDTTETLTDSNGDTIWNFSFNSIRCLNHEEDFNTYYINKKISAADAYKVFEELRKLFISTSNSILAFLNTGTDEFISDYTNYKNNLITFINQLNTMGIIIDYNSTNIFLNYVNAFKTIVDNRIITLKNRLIDENTLEDIKEVIKLRLNFNTRRGSFLLK